MLTPEPIAKNEDGLWFHSALDDLPEDTAIDVLPATEGMEFKYISFDDDAPAELQKLYDEHLASNSKIEYADILKRWEPKVPSGTGWFLVAIYDTEDGPYACFGRANNKDNKKES